MPSTVLFVPGLRDHVADHWQTLLAAELPTSHTVQPLTENKLSLAARVAALDSALARIEGPVILAAHSAGVLIAVHWAQRHSRPIKAALLATPADIETPFPPPYPTHDELAANGWLPIPRRWLPFRSLVAASNNDPLAALTRVAGMASNWGAELVGLGDVGHLNPAAGYGPWPQALALLERLEGGPLRVTAASDIDTDAHAAFELFHSLDAMEGLPAPQAAAPAKARSWPGLALARTVWPGLLAAATMALASTWLSQHYAAPVMLFALLFGMAFHFLHEEGRCVAGIEFTSKAVLRLGVALLGARITASQILGLGVMPIATVVVGVATTIGVGVLAARALGLSRAFGVLSGGAVGICGASAALAIASVLPRREDSERDTILTVVTVTALSTLAMVLYPLIATAVGFDHVRAGIFLGGTIHDVAQVVGAGYTISTKTGEIATYVKLLRVMMLMPVVFAVAVVAARGRGKAAPGPRPPFPLFLVGFAALVALNSLGLIAKPLGDGANEVSRWCLVAAIAALGMKTSFKALIAVGWRPVAVMVLETGWIFALVMIAVRLWG